MYKLTRRLFLPGWAKCLLLHISSRLSAGAAHVPAWSPSHPDTVLPAGFLQLDLGLKSLQVCSPVCVCVCVMFSIILTEPTSNLLQGPCLYGGGFHSLGYFFFDKVEESS